MKAAEAGFHMIDLEVESAEALKKGDLERLREAEPRLIVSYHDFSSTKDLDETFARIQAFSRTL